MKIQILPGEQSLRDMKRTGWQQCCIKRLKGRTLPVLAEHDGIYIISGERYCENHTDTTHAIDKTSCRIVPEAKPLKQKLTKFKASLLGKKTWRGKPFIPTNFKAMLG